MMQHGKPIVSIFISVTLILFIPVRSLTLGVQGVKCWSWEGRMPLRKPKWDVGIGVLQVGSLLAVISL